MDNLQRRIRQHLLCWLLGCFLLADATGGALRIVDWNTAGGPRPGVSTVLEAIGHEEVNGITGPIDVLILQEQSASTLGAIADLLAGIYGEGTYAAAPIQGQTSGAGLPGLVYRTDTIDLIDQTAFGEVNTAAQARSTVRYQLRPDGYDESFDFYVYSNHYKAGTSSSDQPGPPRFSAKCSTGVVIPSAV